MKENQIRELVNELRDIAIEYHGTQQLRERIARTVRAAIIQAGNSPVIPDRWISCSEQMPENGQECLVQTSSGWRYVSFYDAHSRLFYDSPKGDIEYILVTHWMPMPEPPKPETNNE
ncbi:DUF551 domain-containing protein [Salmonella enterica subsp. enterica serovar Newport]|uniref:DUF551 domain-containing protein n=2 Tax=Salmonella enterica I TaxID=59201 RepID=A0A5Y2FF20_SALNE|nr:DUF551 domain-containing protein [Salmonella enterica subsp. enterica serovar Newport]EBS2329463.1 hypothetical protein [Salmonella enterica subsp. enterica serovar Telelkebir]ECD9418558.1 DUF551 domain-containing protein [Salmonella enterica subsp. salamae]ECH9432930.1 DUF551 domain-containing protein [Salmonella enterica subsp. enterica]EBW5304749.1 hypothetical protein [Salmonella enterica subsp. enterica serovar Telelkebir]